MRSIEALLLAASIIALSCAGSSFIPAPNAADAAVASRRWPETSVGELGRGRQLYVGRCAGCHQLKAPRSLRAEQWETEVAEMREEHDVKLTDAEQLLILKYLFAVASREQDGAS